MKRDFRILVEAAVVLFLSNAGVCGASNVVADYATKNDNEHHAKEVTLRLAGTPGPKISPLIYGVNNNWGTVSAQMFPSWNKAAQKYSHFRLIHYPGGWFSEHYNWFDDTEGAWTQFETGTAGFNPGVGPDALLSQVSRADFVLPTRDAIFANDDEAREKIIAGKLVPMAIFVVKKYSPKGVTMFDIGNEWWIMRGGLNPNNANSKAVTAIDLKRYAQVVKALVPAMKAAARQVGTNIEIFASADWQDVTQYKSLRDAVGETVWSQLDGISMHTYCDRHGDGSLDKCACDNIPAIADQARALTGKDKVFDSQWLVAAGATSLNASLGLKTPQDYGIKNASQLVLAIQDIAFARMCAAIVWPVTDYVHNLNFMKTTDYSQPYAPGIVFGWMSSYYEGECLNITGDMPAVAAKLDDYINIIVPSAPMDTSSVTSETSCVHVRIPLKESGASQVVSAEVMYSTAPDVSDMNQPNNSSVVTVVELPTYVTKENDQLVLNFTLNPGTQNRGKSCEIARISIK